MSELFEIRLRVMRFVPHILRGGFRLALRVVFQEILSKVSERLEFVLGSSKNVALQASPWRHGSSKEVPCSEAIAL